MYSTSGKEMLTDSISDLHFIFYFLIGWRNNSRCKHFCTVIWRYLMYLRIRIKNRDWWIINQTQKYFFFKKRNLFNIFLTVLIQEIHSGFLKAEWYICHLEMFWQNNNVNYLFYLLVIAETVRIAIDSLEGLFPNFLFKTSVSIIVSIIVEHQYQL